MCLRSNILLSSSLLTPHLNVYSSLKFQLTAFDSRRLSVSFRSWLQNVSDALNCYVPELVSALITVSGSTGSSALRQTQVSCSNKHTYPNTQHPYPEDGSLGVVTGQEAGGEGDR
jgi:hypothetical protein